MVLEKPFTADSPTADPPRPAAAATLLALVHAQGEVERLSEREQLLSSLLVSVNAVLWAIDWQTRRVLYVSPAYERIFGRSAGLLLADHREWRNSIHPEDLDYAEHSLARVLEQGAVEDREYRIITADGQIRNCLFAREESDLLPLLRGTGTDVDLAHVLVVSIAGKRAGHGIDEPDFLQPRRPMSAIGG